MSRVSTGLRVLTEVRANGLTEKKIQLGWAGTGKHGDSFRMGMMALEYA